MGYIVVKSTRDADQFVIWSTFTECPIWVGARAELVQRLSRDRRLGDEEEPEARIARADETGSSALFPSPVEPFLGWGYDPIFMQRGYLRRHLIGECALRMDDDNERDVTDLLYPLDGEDSVRPVPEASR